MENVRVFAYKFALLQIMCRTCPDCRDELEE